MKKISLVKLPELFAEIAKNQALYVPAGAPAQFTLWEPGLEMAQCTNTVRSAKDFFFPQVENLVEFKVSGKEISMEENPIEDTPFVLFGVRGCDVRSFGILDSVFLEEPADTFYAARRKNSTVISLACNQPAETCFCGAFGIDAANPEGDVTCWQTEDTLYWRANSEKGALLTETISCLEDCEENGAQKQQEKIRQVLRNLPLKDTDFSGFEKDELMRYFNSSKWDALSESCLGCGSCTFVCPTCQCYDVQDFDNGRKVRRFRCWDSCMYSDFTMMAHGTNRPTQKERFRQRFMHKLVYHPSNHNGEMGCVGCGRCLQKCPIHMNIVKVAKALKEGEK